MPLFKGQKCLFYFFFLYCESDIIYFGPDVWKKDDLNKSRQGKDIAWLERTSGASFWRKKKPI